jgi:hypothetical protein
MTQEVWHCKSCGTKVHGPSCFIVTATFGENSREAIHVKRRCRRTFVLNPFMILGWGVYQYYGPILARWSRSGDIAFVLCKSLLGKPIVYATGNNRLRSWACILYLAVLALVGLLLLVPSLLLDLAFRLIRNHCGSQVSPQALAAEPLEGSNKGDTEQRR